MRKHWYVVGRSFVRGEAVSTASELDALNGEVIRLYNAGKYSDAVQIAEKATALTQKALGPDHPDVGQGLNNLAALYHVQGRYADAEPLYKRSLSIREKALGPDHPDVGQGLNNLAALYNAQGRYADAEPLLIRAQAIPGWEVGDITVHFSTNRRQQGSQTILSFASDQVAELREMSSGTAVVRAPKAEVVNRAGRLADAFGQLQKATGRQTNETDLSIHRLQATSSPADIAASVRDRLSRAGRFPGQALLYVHGYNNSFDEAVKRAAMIAFDLDFDGATFVFTWPSLQRSWLYGADRKRARLAVPFLVEMLANIGRELPEVKLHIFAHSTGAEITLNALNYLANRPADVRRPKLGELILAHADAKPSTLARVLPAIKQLAVRVTSYSSDQDVAMLASRWLRFGMSHRIGGRPVYLPGVDAIDTSGLGMQRDLNHNVFVRNPLVFGDINLLMATAERPPDRRTPLFQKVATSKGVHWAYRVHNQS
jgi:esterase/lipase superfamily enzyme